MENKPNRREVIKKIGGAILGSIGFSAEVKAQEKKKNPPREGELIKLENANFSVFPEKIRFLLARNFLVINRKWQVGALYQKDGAMAKNKKGEKYFFQVGTGKNETPTPLGVSRIIRQSGVDYRSGEFKDAENVGAPMPYAQHMVKLKLENGVVRDETPRGIAIHGRETTREDGSYSFMSHGCIGITKNIAEDLRNILKMGDYIIVIDDEKILMNGGGFTENLIKEIEESDTNKNSNSLENQKKRGLWEGFENEADMNEKPMQEVISGSEGAAKDGVKKKELPKMWRQLGKEE